MSWTSAQIELSTYLRTSLRMMERTYTTATNTAALLTSGNQLDFNFYLVSSSQVKSSQVKSSQVYKEEHKDYRDK